MLKTFPGRTFSIADIRASLREQSGKTAFPLPRRAMAAMSAGFLVVAASAAILGSGPGVFAEEDAHSEYRRMLASERGQARQGGFLAGVRQNLFYPVRSQVLGYAAAPSLINFGPFGDQGRAPGNRGASRFLSPSKSIPSAGADSLSRRSVCVRLCDGFFFPVGDYNGPGDDAAHGAACAGMCPGAPTRLYVAPAGTDHIEDAISVRDRQPYRALPVALRYTSRRDSTCSCRGPEQAGINSVSLLSDFTLRRGDKVMTQSGIQVFRGAQNLPWRQSDFASIASSRDISASERKALGAIERASGVVRGTPQPARPMANAKSGPATPVPVRSVSESSGKTVRLIGPQALLQVAGAPVTP